MQLPLCLLLLGLIGCGYALVGLSNNIPDHVRRIYIAPLENETARAEVGPTANAGDH